MRVIFLFLLFFITDFIGAPTAPAVQTELRALQQIRSLIPERLWVQEFSICIDRKGMQKKIQEMLTHRLQAQGHDAMFAVGRSACYFDRATISGEEIRILDQYEEFYHSPFWQTPPYLERLALMRKEIKR